MIISLIAELFKVVTIILSFFDDNRNYNGNLPIFYSLYFNNNKNILTFFFNSYYSFRSNIIYFFNKYKILYYAENKVFYGRKKCFTK